MGGSRVSAEKVPPGVPQVLRATYWGGDAGREFVILVDGKPLATQKLDRSKPNAFLDVEFPLPADLIAGQDKGDDSLSGEAGSVAGGISAQGAEGRELAASFS